MTDCDVIFTIHESSTSQYGYATTRKELGGPIDFIGASSVRQQFILPKPAEEYYSYSSTQRFQITEYHPTFTAEGMSYDCQHETEVELELVIPEQFIKDNNLELPSEVTWSGTPISVKTECASVVDLQNEILDAYIYSAKDTLISCSIIPAGVDVEFRTGDVFVFESGFEIEEGGSFRIGEYEGCN